jgi:hypothetical protein
MFLFNYISLDFFLNDSQILKISLDYPVDISVNLQWTVRFLCSFSRAEQMGKRALIKIEYCHLNNKKIMENNNYERISDTKFVNAIISGIETMRNLSNESRNITELVFKNLSKNTNHYKNLIDILPIYGNENIKFENMPKLSKIEIINPVLNTLNILNTKEFYEDIKFKNMPKLSKIEGINPVLNTLNILSIKKFYEDMN